MAYNYSFEKYKGKHTRHKCPSCGKQNSLTRYIGADGNYLADEVGKCDRVSKCGYHYHPGQYFKDNPDIRPIISEPAACADIMRESSYIPNDIFNGSLSHYSENNFVQFLHSRFDTEIVSNAIRQYHIGTSRQWPGATVFWQVDTAGRVRTGKIMLYNAATGKRVKKGFSVINWVHSIKDKAGRSVFTDYNLKQCYFGEHLLQIHPNKPVAIVESEKTAIIASMYYPALIWISCGGVQGLSKQKSECLTGRDVTAFPDLGCSEIWEAKAKEIRSVAEIRISQILNEIATPDEIREGYDLADFLLRIEPGQFAVAG